MDSAEFFSSHFDAIPAMGIFRSQTPDETIRLCTAAWDAGIGLVEIPVQSRDALPALEAAILEGQRRGRIVGAGTITAAAQLDEVVSLGAQFTVSPGLDEDVIARSAQLGVPHLPGVATATEITRALRSGLSWLKAFPAAQLGPAWISAQLAPFPQIRFVATGGINAENAAAFLAAGCSAVAMGSAFSGPAALRSLDFLTADGGAHAH